MVSFAVVDPATGAIVSAGRTDVDSLAGLIAGSEFDVIAPVPDMIVEGGAYWHDGQDWQDLPPRPGPWATWDGTTWVDPRSPAEMEADLIGARLMAVAAINAAAGPIRRLYVTDIPGQEALYLMKEAEARAWVASADPDPMQFPLISAEVGITAPTADEVAQVYLNLSGLYTAAAAQLETVRLGHIAMAEAAPTVEAAEAAAQAFRDLVA
ncbi:hypothetical protein [Paracoccus sp. ME4]|uniref:hypothetical protein n=1 Tax=Paracoccus sp. ME4 TaxID=3138066 RepID=UPI00398B1219